MSHRQYAINHKQQHAEENLLYLTVSSYDGKWKSMPHTHSFCELFYITDGEGYFSINNTRYSVKKHNFIIVNPHLTHTESTKENQTFSYIVLGIENLLFEFNKNNNEPDQYILDLSDSFSEIKSVMSLMVEESRQQKANYQEILRHYLKILLLKIERITNHKLHSTPSMPVKSDCQYIKEYIAENYAQQITLDSLAKLMHRSRFYVSRTFSDTFGTSPMHYLSEIRIIAAKNLLTTSDFSIQQIAGMTGFSSAIYFSQAFKKSTGISPKDFRIQVNHKTQTLN